MAAGHPQHSFDSARLAGDPTQNETPEFQIDYAPSDDPVSSPDPDRLSDARLCNPPGYRSACILYNLLLHPRRDQHRAQMIALLKIDQPAWECYRYLRATEDVSVLRPHLSQIYEMPEEIIMLLEVVRSDPDWHSIKTKAVDSLASNTTSNTNYSSVRNSGNSLPLINSQYKHNLPATPQDQTEYPSVCTPSSSASYPASPPPNRLRGGGNRYRCCGKTYQRPKNYFNHLQIHHPGSQQAKEPDARELQCAHDSANPTSTTRPRALFAEVATPNRMPYTSQAHAFVNDQIQSNGAHNIPYNSNRFHQQPVPNPMVVNHFGHYGVGVQLYDDGMAPEMSQMSGTQSLNSHATTWNNTSNINSGSQNYATGGWNIFPRG